MVLKTVAYFGEIGPTRRKYRRRNIKHIDIWKEFLVGFFDGACDQRKCGCEAYIVIEPDTFYHLWWKGGRGTNNWSELVALWGTLLCAIWLGIETLKVFGDSKSVIKCVQGSTLFNPFILTAWVRRIRMLEQTFQ